MKLNKIIKNCRKK